MFLGFFMQNVAKPKEVFAIDYVLENVSLTSGPTEFKKGEILTIKAKAADGYAINQSKLQIVMGSKNITSNCTFTAGDKDEEGQILNCTITIPSAQTKLIGKGEKISIYIEAFEIIEDWVYAVTFNGTGIKFPQPTSFRNGDTLNLNIEALDGYAINMASLNLALGSKQLSSSNYQITNENYGYKDQLFGFTLVIPAATTNMAVEGDSLNITLNGVEEKYSNDIYYSLTNINTPTIKTYEPGQELNINITPKDGYVIKQGSLVIVIGSTTLNTNQYSITNEVRGYQNQLLSCTINIPSSTTATALEGYSMNITMDGIEEVIEPTKYNVTYNLTNITAPTITSIEEKTLYEAIFAVKATNFAIEKNKIYVTIGGKSYTGFTVTDKATSQDGVTSLVLKVPAKDVLGDINITMEAWEYFDVKYNLVNSNMETTTDISVTNKVTRYKYGEPFSVTFTTVNSKWIKEFEITSSTQTFIEGVHYTTNKEFTNVTINDTDYNYLTKLTINISDKDVAGEFTFNVQCQNMAVQMYSVEFDVAQTDNYNEVKNIVNIPAPISVEKGTAISQSLINVIPTDKKQYYRINAYQIWNKNVNGELSLSGTVTDVPNTLDIIVNSNIVIKFIVINTYYTVTVNKNVYWSHVSGGNINTESTTKDTYMVTQNGEFTTTYRFDKSKESSHIFAKPINLKIGDKVYVWESNNGNHTITIDSVTSDISLTLSYTEKALKTVSFEKLNNAVFVLEETDNMDIPAAYPLKEMVNGKIIYTKDDGPITLYQYSNFGGYLWPADKASNNDWYTIDDYNYTASAVMNGKDVISNNRISLPYYAASSDELGLVDDIVINATFVSKNTAPIQVVFNDQNAVSAAVNINGSVNTFTNNVNSASGSFAKNGYNLYYDKPEPALDQANEFDTVSMSGASDADQAVDRINVQFGMSTSAAMTDMKYKITGISYSNDGGNSWTDIGGESQESFIEATAQPVSTEYYIDTVYIKNMTIVKIHVSILQQDAVTVTINCDEHSYVKYNGTNRSNLTLTFPYGSTINLLPLYFDEYYTFDKATASEGKPVISETAGTYYLNVGTFTKDLTFEIKSKANYWTVTKTVDNEAVTLLTTIPDKVTKGKALTFDYKRIGGYRYNYGSMIATIGNTSSTISNLSVYNESKDTYTVTIQTTTSNGNINIALTPSERQQIPLKFNLANGTATFEFSPEMEDKWFVNVNDKNRTIENNETIYFYDYIPLIGNAIMTDEFAADAYNRRWTVFNITKNSDGTKVDLGDSNIPTAGSSTASINLYDYQSALSDPAGYEFNVMHTRNYTSKVVYAIDNRTDTDYSIYLNGTNGFATTGSGSGSTSNASCVSVSFGNYNPSKWMVRPIYQSGTNRIIANRNSVTEIDRIAELSMCDVNVAYNSNSPAEPGYVNWNPSYGSIDLTNQVAINAWLAIFSQSDVGFDQEHAVQDESIKWGIKYKVSNDAGQTWSEEAIPDEPYNIANLNNTLEARFSTYPAGYERIAGNDDSTNYEEGILMIIITIENTSYY